uniref:Calcineurin-like phosphoesterase n=1 Tax=Candidatus Kentrum sp. TUN TaxID=2126343 RepID=A0A450ZTQ7_9GAMM|nr:MAG: Calcineurin-like phosphoesterase [Candidatus Kentron sp. TUN]
MITWLHLSDIHLCSPKTGWDADRILQYLREDLEKMEQKEGLRPDLLLVTGDLAYGQLGEGDLSLRSQFEDVYLFLEEVRTTFSTPIPTERIFPVPGNHDVDRRKIMESLTDWLDNLATKKSNPAKFVSQMLNDATGEWPGLMQRLETYKAFLQECYPHLLRDEEDEKRLCYAHILDIDGHRMGIAGLNSAWSCRRKEEKGDLWLGRWQLNQLGTQLKGAEIKLALAHHPLTWLVPQENPALNPMLERNFDFFLHGHEHQAWIDEKSRHIRLAAGACYGENSTMSGYSFVRLDPKAGTGQVWLRRFDDMGLGWIPRVIPGYTDDHGRWGLDLAWLKPKAAVSHADTTMMGTPRGGFAHPTKTPSAVPTEQDAQPATEKPPNPHGPESRGVFGRAKEIAGFTRELQEKPILLLHGVAGIGKSWLINEIHREIHRVWPNGMDYKLVQIRATRHLGADEIFEQLAGVLPCLDYNPKAPRDLLKRLAMEELAEYRDTAKPCILHIHRLHHALGGGGFLDGEVRTFLRGLVKHLPQFRVILESTKAAPENLFPAEEYTIHRVKGLDETAVRKYFRRPFVNKPQQGWELTEEQAQEIYRRLGGEYRKEGAHPLGMNLLAVVADGFDRDPWQVLERHPDKFRDELEESLFQDLYENILTPPQQHMLRMAALYRQSIPHTHEFSLNTRVGDEDAFYALGQHFLLSSDENQERYYLHGLFAELTRQRIRPSSPAYQDDHSVIAEEWLSTVRGISTRRLPYIKAANEAVYHLLEAQEFARLNGLSTTLLGWDTPAQLEAWSVRLHGIEDFENNRYVLELLTALQPREHKNHRFLGECIEKTERRGADKALEHYLKAHELLPTYPQYLANIGRCWLARDEPEAFVALVDGLDDSVRDKAVNAFVHDIYSRCLEHIGKGDEASRIRQEQIRRGRATAPIYNDEAQYQWQQQNDSDAALAVLEKAGQAGCADDHTLSVKASILQDMGRGAEASQIRQEEIKKGTRNAVFYNDEARYQWQQQKDPIAALAVLEKAEQAGCANDHTLAIKAKLLEALDRGAEASQLRCLEISKGTRNAVFYNDEAVYLRNQGYYEGASTILKLAEQNRCGNEYTFDIRDNMEHRVNMQARYSLDLPSPSRLKLPIGSSSFPELIRKGYYYVDKSLFIQSVLDTSAKVLLLPRPRRFGKTLNLSMLRAFLERGKPEQAKLFEGLAITRAGKPYLVHQGRYPVVFLTLKDIKERDWESCLQKLKYEIAKEFQRHADLLEKNILSEWEKKDYESILSREAPQFQYENSFKDLLVWLQRAYGEQVVLLVDEYDTPVHAGYQYDYYDEVTTFMRNWLGGALKDQDALERGVLTGILRIAKESIFSGLNNLRVEGILETGLFTDKFGFTESEVERLLADFRLSDTLPEVREWYNGYRFGKADIYNPWSIANFIEDQSTGDPSKPFRSHWVNTSENSLILGLIQDSSLEVHKGVEQLLKNGVVSSEIDDTLSLRNMDVCNMGSQEKSVWSLLLFSGYLKTTSQYRRGDLTFYDLQLPNREIRTFFINVINKILEAYLDTSTLRDLFQTLVRGDITTFEKHLKTLVINFLSFHDTGGRKGKKPEVAYQSFVLGLLANLGHQYRIESNIESGLGRPDILMIPKTNTNNRPGIVMEFKRLGEGETMERKLKMAMEQIEKNNYDARIRAEGIKKVLKLGIVFDGKELQVRSAWFDEDQHRSQEADSVINPEKTHG